MAIKLQIKDATPTQDSLLAKLPRMSFKVRAFGKEVNYTYVPVIETLAKVVREKKGLVQASIELLNEFEGKKVSRSKAVRKA